MKPRTYASITRRWPRRSDSHVGSRTIPSVDRDGLLFDRRRHHELLTFSDWETDLHPRLLVFVNRDTRSHLSKREKQTLKFCNSTKLVSEFIFILFIYNSFIMEKQEVEISREREGGSGVEEREGRGNSRGCVLALRSLHMEIKLGETD